MTVPHRQYPETVRCVYSPGFHQKEIKKESLRHKCLNHKWILIVIVCITLIYTENVILMKMYTHWAPLAHSFPYVSKTFSGPEIGAQVERPPVQ